MAHPGGRPTTYKLEYCEQLLQYFSTPPNHEVIETVEGKNWSKETTRLVANQLPLFERFATMIGTTHKTLLDWSHRHEEFGEAYARAKELQKSFLIENAINGLYNPQFAMFTAKNITDMRDKQEIEHTVQAAPKQLGFEVIEAPDRREIGQATEQPAQLVDNTGAEDTEQRIDNPAGGQDGCQQ